MTEPGNGSLTNAGNRATGARTRSYVSKMSFEDGFQLVYTPQSGGVFGCCDLRAPFHPVLPVCGHLVAEFVQVFGEVVVRGGGLDGTEGVVGFEEGDIDFFDGTSEVLKCKRGLLSNAGDIGVDVGEAEVRAPCDTEAVDRTLGCGDEIWRCRAYGYGVTTVESSHSLEEGFAASLTVRAMGPGCPKKLGAGGPGTRCIRRPFRGLV